MNLFGFITRGKKADGARQLETLDRLVMMSRLKDERAHREEKLNNFLNTRVKNSTHSMKELEGMATLRSACLEDLKRIVEER